MILLGIGLEKQELNLEGVGVLLLLGLLDTGIVVLGDDLAAELFLKKGLGIVECIVNDHLVNILDKGTETSNAGVGLDALETDVE